MVSLRETGHSLPEIKEITGRGHGTVFRYIKNVKVLPEFSTILRIKQGGSRKKADEAWRDASSDAQSLLGDGLSLEQKLCILACLYWGEGNKMDLNLMNSDPGLIKVFVGCLYEIGVPKDNIKINLRLHDDIDRNKAIIFWAKLLSIEPARIGKIEVIQGKKTGKLKYGMCRVRVAKSATYFKLIMSLISIIKTRFDAAVVQRIEQGTPKP